MINDLTKSSEMLQAFKGESLGKTVAKLESSFVGANKITSASHLADALLSDDLMQAALIIKRNASQIDEIVHTLGILLALPSILDQDEQVESLSLAAGNTGKGFDLETSKRIAEFTFIRWQGGPEVIRQNKVFKDFYFLAETETPKLRELYVVGTEHVVNFFNSQRELPQILAGNAKLGDSFRQRYGNRFQVVNEYYRVKKDVVSIRDVRPHLAMIKNL
jgi:hypothetical protein